MLGRQKVPVKELEQAVGKAMAKVMQLVKEKASALAREQEKERVPAKDWGRVAGKEKERAPVKVWERVQGRVKAKASVVVAAAPALVAQADSVATAIGLASAIIGTSVDEVVDVARVLVAVVDTLAAVAQAWRRAFSAAFHSTAHPRFVFCILPRAHLHCMQFVGMLLFMWIVTVVAFSQFGEK